MPWPCFRHRPLKWFQSKRKENSEKTNNGHQLNDIDALIEPTQPPGESSEAITDAKQPNSTNVFFKLAQNSGETTTSSEPENLWAKAEQRLAQDEKMSRILKEATEIVEESGLKAGSHGTADHQQLRSFLNNKVDELEEKKWMVRVDDHYIGVRDQLTRLIRNILVLKDVVNTAASASPPAAIVCAGMTVSLLLFIQAVEQKDSLLKGLEKTSALIPQLHMMEDLYLHSDANVADDFMEKFKEGLISLYCKIVEFQARALCFLRKNLFSQISRNMFKQDQWDALTESIMGQETEAQSFTRLIDAAERKSDREKISQYIEQASQKHQLWQATSDRYIKVKNFFKLLYACPYRDRKDRNDNRVLGTCEWFTSHPLFQHWDRNDDSSLLWVSADPGCGKSVLSKYLIDEVLPSIRKRRICYFFFRDDYPDQKRSTIALASILRQLFMAQPHLLSDSILDQFDTDGERLVESFRELWDILMSITASSNSGEVICVMDALDECQEDDRNQLIGAVRDLYLRSNNNRKLKFILTSRPYGHIRREFRELENQMPTIHLSGEGQAEVEKISHEISLVIMKRVQDIGSKKYLEQHEQDFLQEKLTEIPNQTYLWVTLTLDYIQGLDGFTKGKVRETVHDKIPNTVDKAYDRILSRSKDKRKAKHLLHIVLAAKRPLSVEELSLAMALKTEGQSHDDIREEMEPVERFTTTLRDLCGLILVVVDNKVYLLHQTVKEFLVQNSTQPDNSSSPNSWKHALAVRESNKILAEICVWYLHAASTETSLDDLLDYSVLHWPDHFREACFLHRDRMTMLGNHLCAPGSKLYDTWSNVHDKGYGFPKNPTPVIIASLFGLDAIVQQLFEDSDLDIDSKDSRYGQTPLSWAARMGHEAVVKLLLDTEKVDIDSKDSTYGQTPLSWAARMGHEAVVKLLLDTEKVDIDSKDSTYGQTPLSWAARMGHEAVVKLLLDTEKVDIDSKDSNGQTPLSWAARMGHEAVVKLLLDTEKVDIDSKDSTYGQTPLSWAAEGGHEAVVKLLLDTEKVDIDSKDSTYDQTPLSWAARMGHEAVVKLLLDTEKVDIDSKNSGGQTPLSRAAEGGHEAVVKLLLDTEKVDIDSKDSDGQTPLSWAAEAGHEAVVKLLLDTEKVDIDSKNSGGQTPLSSAARMGHEAVVKLLLDTEKVDIDSKDSDGQTPLSWAARMGHEDVVKLLLDTEKVDIDSKDSTYDQTPLSRAAEGGHEAVVKLLLDTEKVDIDSKDSDGQTPLSWAARMGHEAVVRLLLDTDVSQAAPVA